MTSMQKGFLQMLVDNPPPCTTEDPDIFFAGHDRGISERNEREAKAVCRTCPLIFACYQFALETNDGYAIMGGRTPTERAQAQNRYNIQREREAA